MQSGIFHPHVYILGNFYREILTDGNGNLLVEGDRLYRLKLAETLKTVIVEGGDALYTGSLAETFAADIQAMGGIITAQDMADFE